ncbi:MULTISPECIES: Crp/Fnr family transcriptional regulator [Citromicrobium]|uniref:Crp/Fnr family transcriptional regulator n=1 Tax=Citromicrobium TaxID=72173 RepID=UPI0001DD0CBF|nr:MULTISPECIES: Crp/Fnr family transcriptional regulator [Citromicrobium]ALG59439.1 transcriptional regulator [Citromicrobium sp. JL477]KPM16129.1 transcriptional regulator [Citromicrobium sp. JL1351]KPM19408.1 transcriptional regulator [Citromicrobium sp. JL31]KPM23770.1 transcriptional regulator [Citromicrobium sp. JL2201]
MEFPNTGDFLAGRLRDKLGHDDQAYIESLISETREAESGEVLISRGTIANSSTILISGYVFRTIESGNRRFIVGIHVPGDFIDLHAFALKRLDHNIVASGPVTLGIAPHQRLRTALEEKPRIARALWFATLLDAAIHRKWIQMLEQLDAPRRIAHIYCELHRRLELIGQANNRSLRTPFTQIDLADMCGVSAIHANRAVGKLRELELAEIRRGDLYTSNWDALREYAQFDGAYLYSDGPLRFDQDWL